MDKHLRCCGWSANPDPKSIFQARFDERSEVSPRTNPQIQIEMKTILLVKDIYREAFIDLGHFITKNYFKAFAWFSFAMFTVVLYAFIFRVVTGFAFD